MMNGVQSIILGFSAPEGRVPRVPFAPIRPETRDSRSSFHRKKEMALT